MPTSPLNAAGMRIEPPPSPPVAIGTSPPATAADDPPDDPPAVLPRSHGLWVVPLSFDVDTLSPPNSEAVHMPTRAAPAPTSRSIIVLS